MIRKVLSINEGGQHIECIKDDSQTNPYRVIVKWYDGGWHRRTVVKYGNFESVICYLSYIAHDTQSWK